MRELARLSMVCADSTRSRAYIQNMIRAGLRPAAVLVLPRPAGAVSGASTTRLPDAPDHARDDPLWQSRSFDPNTALPDDLDRLGAPVIPCTTHDLNQPQAIAAITALPGDVTLFSGYGAQILRRPVLDAGKRFLHVHGGYVPQFRGSTTNYFSMLSENTLGASAIFLTAEIDAGPVLLRRRYPAPPDRTKLDHLHDSAARSDVLIAVLDHYARTGTWLSQQQEAHEAARTYYVIHPVLKHLAVYPNE